MSNLFLKPALDADGKPVLVRDPVTHKPLDPAGENKEKSHFWLHRIRDKDVVESAPPVPASSKSVAEPIAAKSKSQGDLAPVSFAKRD